MKTFTRILFAICAVILFRGMLACGGGGGGVAGDDASTDTTGYTIADRVSVVDAQESASPSVSALAKALRGLRVSVPADSDYMLDEQNIWVHERSADVFGTINEILCMMNQTAYAEMVNLGSYIAQVDIGQCEVEDNASAAGEEETNTSSGNTMTEYENWTVNSYHSAGEPHYVEVWAHQEGDEYEPAMDIDVLVAITQPSSDANPLGLFTMNFVGSPVGGGQPPATSLRSDDMGMRGILRTIENADGRIGLQFVDRGDFGDEFSFIEQATLYKITDGSSGSGSMAMTETTGPSGIDEMSSDFAFNENYFLRTKGADSVCLDRENYDETVWGYGVYDGTTGMRVERDSGFPIRYEDYWGWAGYYGIWLPNDIFLDMQGGETVYKIDYNTDGPPTETPFTVFKAPGKTLRHVKQTMTLGEIAGIPLSVWRCEGEGACSEYRVEYNNDAVKLFVTGVRSQENYYWVDLQPEPFVPNEFDWSINGWSQALGGSIQINRFDSETGLEIPISSDSVVIFHSESVVMPTDDVPAVFVCFENCFTDDGVVPQSSYSVPFEETFSYAAMQGPLADGVTNLTYTFDREDMAVKYQGDIVDPTDMTGEHQFGYWMNLVDLNDVDELRCPFEPYGTCSWKVWDTLDVYYSYETGLNPWNMYSTLQDPNTNEFLSFDPPLMLEYTHTTGTKYVLQYEGYRNLHGIPGTCMKDGEEVSCEDSMDDFEVRWVPQFSIPDGSTLTDLQDNEYLVKGLDKEQRMTLVDTSVCTDAGLTVEHQELLDISEFVDPDIGEEPDVTDPPAVIAGEVQ